MKSTTKFGILALLISTVMLVSVQAQPGAGKGNGPGHGQGWNKNADCRAGMENILPDLTEDQKSALKDLRDKNFQEMKAFKNKMGEIRAKQHTIMSANEIDQRAAEKVIDEKTALMNKQMKVQVAHKAAMKNILTDEQLLQMEKHHAKRQSAGKRKGRGYHSGNFGPRQRQQQGHGPRRGV